MNTTFNFNRLGLLLKRYITENIQREITFWGIAILVFALVRNDETVRFFLYITGFIFAANQFKIFAYTPGGMHYLLIPATHTEKLTASILLSTVYYFIMFLITYVIGNSLGTVVGNLIFGLNNPIDLSIFSIDANINSVPENLQHFVKNSIFKTFGTFAFIQSVFLLGSIYFKRNAVGKTMLAIALFGAILIAIEILFVKISFGTYSIATNNLYLSYYDFNQSTTLNVLSKTFEIGSYLVVPFLWIVSYFRLTEKEV